MRFIETWIPATLVATRDLAPGIREFLILPDQFDGTAYPVGSHINISVTIDGLPETRSYSLVGEASSDGFRIAVRRAEDSRGGSRYMWSLAPGARLDITRPASLLSQCRHSPPPAPGHHSPGILGTWADSPRAPRPRPDRAA